MIEQRYEANKIIIKYLERLVEKYPEWRFKQLLYNVGMIPNQPDDTYYEESTDTLHLLENVPIINGTKIS